MRAFEMIYRDEVTAKAVAVFRYLCDRQGKYDFCYVSHRRIAADLKISVATVKRALDELQGKGYVSVEQRRRSNGSKCCNVYRCRDPG